MSTEHDIFDQFTEVFKIEQEDKLYTELKEVPIKFDKNIIKLEDPHNFENLINELNEISSLIFRYKMILAMQGKVIQRLEDDYNVWYAQKWVGLDNQQEPKFDRSGALSGYKKVEKTGTAIEKYIIAENSAEYSQYRNLFKEEKYKLEIIKAAVSSLESYSYKLHSILNYKEFQANKGL